MSRRPRDPKRVSVSVRLTEATAVKLREFVRYHAGHPSYVLLGPLVEQAVLAEMQRIELKLAGAIPMDDRKRMASTKSSINDCVPQRGSS